MIIQGLGFRRRARSNFLWLKAILLSAIGLTLAAGTVLSSDTAPKPPDKDPDHALIQQLLQEIEDLKARVAGLEAGSGNASAAPASSQPTATPVLKGFDPPASSTATAGPEASVGREIGDVANATIAPDAAKTRPSPPDQGGHNMEIPGGPKLNIRGFLDFNLGFGSAANPLVYPVAPPPTTIHNSFQLGELDLFLSSRISSNLDFLGEVIFGSDFTNEWGIDIERAQLTYKLSQFFQLSAGRMHTAIGYYNTAYHHGAWFQTATGRPFMDYFEDSGGILPVHIVGVEMAGLVPRTGKVNAHWIVELGNGESSLFQTNPVNPVQNFVSDTNHKAFNVAGYIKPDWVTGLQIGANYYNSTRVPTGVPHVNNSISGIYLVYIKSPWEFLNEFEVQRDHPFGSPITYNTPLGYTQISRKFGIYRPYFRWQEVNVPVNDPLFSATGRYEGPSFGLRINPFAFAALKVQYNRIYTRNPLPMNGLDAQMAFTF